ncbi:hypothetical protein ACFL59_08405, partial [Planctomycetota bacterium]
LTRLSKILTRNGVVSAEQSEAILTLVTREHGLTRSRRKSLRRSFRSDSCRSPARRASSASSRRAFVSQ